MTRNIRVPVGPVAATHLLASSGTSPGSTVGYTPMSVVSGRYVGKAATFAALPSSHQSGAGFQVGDWSELTADDGPNLRGRYIWNGAAWAFDTVSASAPEVIVSAVDLTGVAPVGARWGYDTVTGRAYYVSAGNWVAFASGERYRFLNTIPTLLDLAIDEQAVVVSGIYQSTVWENVAGTIVYRGQVSYPAYIGVFSVANANLIANAIGIGQKLFYVLTDPSGPISAGLMELTSVDNVGTPNGIQRSIPFGSVGGGGPGGSITPQAGWTTQVGAGLPDQNVDLGTLQDLERVVKTMINANIAAGLYTA